jgi:hypothetical protein
MSFRENSHANNVQLPEVSCLLDSNDQITNIYFPQRQFNDTLIAIIKYISLAGKIRAIDLLILPI